MISKRRHPPKSRGISKIVYQTTSIENHVLAANYITKSTSHGWPKSPTIGDLFVGSNDPSKCVAETSQDFLYLFTGPFFWTASTTKVDPRCKGHTAKEIPPDGIVFVCWKHGHKILNSANGLYTGKDVPLNHHDMYFGTYSMYIYIYTFPKKCDSNWFLFI